MRGEKKPVLFPFARNLGSPPHALGKGIRINRFTLCIRITPACAGKRFIYAHIVSLALDHPRMRGEKYITDEDDKSGITPACAGKRMLPGLLRRRAGDHPRMRGEKLLKPKNL